ncbi:MAG: hypothetical protein ACTSYA_12150 [Candidatus Kariarchaeaceae archaeon]
MVYLETKDLREIQDKIVNWINDNIDDPYEQATNKTRDSMAYGDDFNLKGINPKVHVDISESSSEFLTGQGKTDYLEEEEHSVTIYYYNQKGHKYAFNNGEVLKDEAQCWKFLQDLKTKLKENATDFGEYFHKMSFGTISKPVFSNATSSFVSMIPVTIFTYRR